MKFRLVESITNTYRFVVINRDDSHYSDEIEAYSLAQAKYLAQKMHKGCLIRDLHQVTFNEDPDGEQLSMFEGLEDNDTLTKVALSTKIEVESPNCTGTKEECTLYWVKNKERDEWLCSIDAGYPDDWLTDEELAEVIDKPYKDFGYIVSYNFDLQDYINNTRDVDIDSIEIEDEE